MKSRFYLFCLAFTISSGLFHPAFANEFDFYMDYARFRGAQGFGYLEFYFGIPRDRLRYIQTDEGYQAGFQVQLEIYQADSLISSQSWNNTDRIPSLDDIQTGQILQDVQGLYLKPGMYSVQVVIEDQNIENRKSKKIDLNVPNLAEDRLSLSDIQLALHIKRDSGESKFIKNGYRILPNPGRVYTVSGPVLYYYAEIYGLSPLAKDTDSSFTVSVDLRNDQGEFVQTLQDKKKRRLASSLVEVGNIYVGSLNTAAYSLNIRVIDHSANDTTESRILFYMYRQQDLNRTSDSDISSMDVKDIEFLSMDDVSLDEHFKYIQYIATRSEQQSYDKLDLTGKRKFLQEFWQRRDSDPFTMRNEYKDQYYAMLRLANQRYTTPNTQGWETDRGRVLVLYGQPDDIQRYTFGNWGKPYEIWQYFKVEGGVEFVFADISGYGAYKLIHSSATNEIHDYNWRDRLN